MRKNILELKILSNLSKQELIDRVLDCHKKRESQKLKLQELEEVLLERKNQISTLELENKELYNNKKEREIIRQYEILLTEYRLEISDLKDEIEDWKSRYVNKS